MADMTVLILTFNEEKNISDCINSVKKIANRIVVIDSGSTDNTVDIARSLGAEVLYHPWENHSKQYIWGEKEAKINTKWVFRIDADERLTEESSKEVENLCTFHDHTDVNGIIVRFKVVFMGKELRHGGIYPFRKLLIYKYGKAFMEEKNMDEHIILKEGRSVELKNDSLHKDYKDLTTWIEKHNKYSNLEMIDFFENTEQKKNFSNMDTKTKIKSIVKFNVYYKLPMGMRAHLYYIFRYYFKMGFLDGKEGKIFAFLQAYWYRFLVDAKIHEKKKKKKKNDVDNKMRKALILFGKYMPVHKD